MSENLPFLSQLELTWTNKVRGDSVLSSLRNCYSNLFSTESPSGQTQTSAIESSIFATRRLATMDLKLTICWNYALGKDKNLIMTFFRSVILSFLELRKTA